VTHAAASDLADRLRSLLAERYDVLEEIGRGGSAVVFRGRDRKLERDVAVKVLWSELAVTIGAERFLREVQVEARLHHPNILAVYDWGQAGDLLYCVMPLASGEPLRHRLSREGPLPVDDALDIADDVGAALAFAHAAGIVHRDIKPENILLIGNRAVVADFGIACAVADVGAERLTETGIAIGTPAYMSPEQGSGSRSIDRRSDIYSLACVVYEMLAGEPPFGGHTAQAIIAKHLNERVPSLQVVRPDLPAHVTYAIERALAKTAADRFPSVEKFTHALRDPRTAPTRVTKGTRRLWLAAVISVVVVGAAIVKLVWPDPGPSLSMSKVAVLPLSVRGLADADGNLGVGLADLLGAAVGYAGPLRFIDVSGWLEPAEVANPALISAEEARRIARDRGAGSYIRGVVQGHHDSATVILRLFSVAGDSLLGQFPANGPYPGELHRLTLRAVRPLLQTLVDPGRQVNLSPLEDRQTAAVLRWLEGERAYRLSRFAQSLEAYEGALAIDSALVLAAIKGSQAANWIHDEGKATALIELAEQRADLLPDAYRDLAHGLRAYLAGAADSALFWLGRAVERDPGWAEAHAAVGEVYYHKLPSGGALESTADAEFRAAQTADSLFLPPLFHIAEIALRRGDVADARVAAARYAVGTPAPEFTARLQVMLQCVEDPRAMRWAGAASPAVLVGASKALSGGASQWRCAEGAANAVLQDTAASLAERWGAALVLNGIFMATGRGAVARVLVDSVVASGIGPARGLYILDAVAGGPMAQDAAESDSLARDRYGSDYAAVRSTGQLWLLGVWNAHVGRREPLRAVAHELAARASASADPADSAYAEGISALLALAEGDSARALQDLAAAVRVQSVTGIGWGLSEPLPVERIRFAEVLLAQGRHGDAIAAAEVFDHHEPVAFLPFLVRSLEVRLRAAEAARSGNLAASYRERLASLGWLGEER